MTYKKETIENETLEGLYAEIAEWKSEHSSVNIVSETYTQNGDYKCVIIYQE